MGGPRGSAAETLTEKEAAMLEAIGRGENPCARVGEENTAVTGTRRRIVGGLRKKGMIAAERGRTNIVGKWVTDKDQSPELTDKGRAFIAGRRDTEPAPEPDASELEDGSLDGVTPWV